MTDSEQEDKECFLHTHFKGSFLVSKYEKCNEDRIDWCDIDMTTKKKIRMRTCDKNVDLSNAKVCSKHLEKYGQKYTKNFSGRCFWPHHRQITKSNNKNCQNPYDIEREESFWLFERNDSILLPMDSQICEACYNHEELGFGPMKDRERFDPNQHPTPQSQHARLDLGGGGDANMSSEEEDDDSSDPDFVVSDSEELQDAKTKALYTLIEADGINLQKVHKRILGDQSDYDRISEERRRQIRKFMGAGIAAVLHTVSTCMGNDSKMWKDARETGCVEKFLKTESLPSQELLEVMNDYNTQ